MTFATNNLVSYWSSIPTYEGHIINNSRTNSWRCSRPSGLMDKASASGAGDCGFKSNLGWSKIHFIPNNFQTTAGTLAKLRWLNQWDKTQLFLKQGGLCTWYRAKGKVIVFRIPMLKKILNIQSLHWLIFATNNLLVACPPCFHMKDTW